MFLSNNGIGTPVYSYTGQGAQKIVQAQLATNINNTSLVLGNANSITDTVGTGNWKLYVSPSTSTEAITSASASTEWTAGSLLSYTDVDYYMFYPFNTSMVSGNTVLNKATETYDAILYGNASIINDVPSPATKPAATGTGYLSMNVGTGQYMRMNQQPISLNSSGISFAFWFRWNNTVSNTPVFSFDDGTNYFIIYMWTPDWCVIAFKTSSGTNSGYLFNRGSYQIAIGDWVHVAFRSSNGSYYLNGIKIGSISYNAAITLFQPTNFYLGNTSASASFLINGLDFASKPGTISVDNFIFYNKILTEPEIGALYAKANIYYTFDSDSISGGTSVGSKASGSYVYNATLVNGASIDTTNPSPAPTAGTGHLSLTSTNTVATNPHVRLTYQPVFNYTQNWFSVAFWARSNSTLGSSAKITFFDFANSIAASENANYSYSMYLQSNNIRAKISYGTSGTATDDILMYTDSSILTDNVWRHYVWTIDNPTTWRLYINSVLVFTKSSGFNRGTPLDYVSPSGINYTNCFIGRDAGSWQTASFSGAIDEFRWYSSRTINQTEIDNLYYTTAPVGKLGRFQNPSGGIPYWMPIPATVVEASETSYTVKSTEIALYPGANSTYAVWTAPKTTNLKIDVSFADYHSRSVGVGFQMFKINADDTFGSVIFPRTVTGNALTNAASTNYLSVPSANISVSAGDKVVYRIDANGNTTSASSVIATNIYADNNYILPLYSTNINETQLTQAQLATNLNSAYLVSGNANTVYDTVGTGNWKFYIAGNTSTSAITSSSSSAEWSVSSPLTYESSTPIVLNYEFDAANQVGSTIKNLATDDYALTLYNGASIATATPAPYSPGYLSMNISSGQYASATVPFSLSTPWSFSFWHRTSGTDRTGGGTFTLFEMGNTAGFGLRIESSPNWKGINSYKNGTQFDGYYYSNTNDTSWTHYVITLSGNTIYNGYINGVKVWTGFPNLNVTSNFTYMNFGKSNMSSVSPPIGGSYVVNIDKFQIHNKALTADEVIAIYSQASIYYPFETADISLSAPTKIGDFSSGSYVYNGTLVGSSIGVDANSRVSGKGYLSLTNSTYFKIVPFSVASSGLTISFWGRFTDSTSSRIFDMRSPEISLQRRTAAFALYVTGVNDVLTSGNVFDGVWRHYAVTIAYAGTSGATSAYKLYTNGAVTATATAAYPALGSRSTYNIGSYGDTGTVGMDGGIDDFRIYQRAISAAEIATLYTGIQPPAFKDATTGVTWITKPAISVDATETSYTVKSNEIALKPGTNSTYAIWTAPKTSNIRIDVSFADYHSQSAGVGFQIFKINSDNTFGSVIFPRTVTSAILTDASSNYLTVPTTSLSVSTGDKVVYRIDANGNTTAASSVLATNIYSYSGIWN